MPLPPNLTPLPLEIQRRQSRVYKIAALYVTILDILLEVKQIPEGHIYAHCMGQCTLEEFQTAIALLIKQGKATSRNHLLTLVADPTPTTTQPLPDKG
jgi:hypothetical protein